jgi:hypothetical protein
MFGGAAKGCISCVELNQWRYLFSIFEWSRCECLDLPLGLSHDILWAEPHKTGHRVGLVTPSPGWKIRGFSVDVLPGHNLQLSRFIRCMERNER